MKSLIVFEPIPGKRKESDEMLRKFSERLDEYERKLLDNKVRKSLHAKAKA